MMTESTLDTTSRSEAQDPAVVKCRKCSRVLINPRSIARGFGPACWVEPPPPLFSAVRGIDYDYRCIAVRGVDAIIITDYGRNVASMGEMLRDIAKSECIALHDSIVIYRNGATYDSVGLTEEGITVTPLLITRHVRDETDALAVALTNWESKSQ